MTTSVQVRYRPIKVGFLIEENNINDVVKCAEINSKLWGGIYNPIIPVGVNFDYTKNIIEIYSVDILYPVSTNEYIQKVLDVYTFLHTNITSFSKTIFSTDKNRYYILDIEHLIKNQTKDIENLLVYQWNRTEATNALFSVIFGYLNNDENGFKFHDEFINRKNPSIRNINEIGIGVYLDTIYPIKFTGIDIVSYSNLADHFSIKMNANALYFGHSESFDDLVYFWNLRAYGYKITYYAFDLEGVFNENLEKFIEDNSIEDVNGFSRCHIFYRKINMELYFKSIREKISEEKSLHHLLHDSYLGIQRHQNPLKFYQDTVDNVLASIDNNDPKRLTFSLDTSIKKNSTTKQDFIVSFKSKEEPYWKQTFNIPYIQDLHEFFSRKMVSKIEPFNLRLEKDGLGVIISTEASSISIHPISFKDIIFRLLEYAGLKPQQAQPGILTNHIIYTLNGLDGCRVFKIQGVRDILKKLGVNDAITKSEIQKVIYEANFDKYKSLFIEKRETKNLTPEMVVNFLLKKDFFRAGLELPCKSCNLDNWLPVKRLDDYWTCDYCGYSNQLSILLNKRGDWKFRKSGFFAKDNNQEGAIPVILTLSLFDRLLNSADNIHYMIYETAIKFSGKQDCEMDFCVINTKSRYGIEFGFGECKDKGGAIDQNDINNLKYIYDQLNPKGFFPFIIISKTSESFNEAEIEVCKQAYKNKYRIIMLNNTELESFWLSEIKYSKKVPHQYCSSLNDLYDNTISLYFSEPIQQVEVLGL